MARLEDETALTNVVILRSDNARMKRMCASLERPTVLYLARLLIHYGVEHIDEVLAWYRDRAAKAARTLPGDETEPD